MSEEETCYACDRPVVKGCYEIHHVKPQCVGGEGDMTVVLCRTCHDLVDRVPLAKWPIDMYLTALKQSTYEVRLVLLKALSLAYQAE